MKVENYLKRRIKEKKSDQGHNFGSNSEIQKTRIRDFETKKILSIVKNKINERKHEIDFLDYDGLQNSIKKIAWELIESEVNNNFSYLMLSSKEKYELLEKLIQNMFGFGVLEPFLMDESITEIMINGSNKIYIERNGKVSKAKDSKGNYVEFSSEKELRNVIEKIVAPINRKVDESDPIVDARLPDGSRVNIVLNPISLDGTAITIRKFPENPYNMKQLVEFGALTSEIAELLKKMVKARYNIIVSGGTGSGKTTFLNALSMFIPEDRRVVTVEDSAELKFSQVDNLVRLETRPPNVERQGEISIRDLVKTALRMRPDQIIVGEVRGGEALDMLQAMNTGHDGSLSTAHANSANDLLTRIETMVLMSGMELPIKAIRQQVASAIDFIVHLKKMRDGRRVVSEIVELIGMNEGEIETKTIFSFEEDYDQSNHDKVVGSLRYKGVPIKNESKFFSTGIYDFKNYFK